MDRQRTGKVGYNLKSSVADPAKARSVTFSLRRVWPRMATQLVNLFWEAVAAMGRVLDV